MLFINVGRGSYPMRMKRINPRGRENLPGRFGDAQEFAEKYDLDSDNIQQRKALYWARSALSTTQWSDEYKNVKIAGWLRQYVRDRLV